MILPTEALLIAKLVDPDNQERELSTGPLTLFEELGQGWIPNEKSRLSTSFVRVPSEM